MNNNSSSSNNNSHNNISMPYPESEEEEELSGSYNITDNGNQLSDCSSSNSSAVSSSGKTASSSNSSNSSDDDDDDNDNEDIDDEDASDQNMQSDSDSDDATTTQSDELELAQLSKSQLFRLPRGLCESASLFHEFFSVDTWQMLPNNMQAQLQPLLPSYAALLTPPQAAAEQQRTLLQLFNGGLQRFGQSPLLRLQRQLEEGSLRPDVLQLRLSIERSQRRERRFQQAERLSRLAKELFLSREQILQQVYAMAPPPDANCDRFKMQSRPRPRKRKTPTLHRENKFCVERAGKRYCQELAELSRDLQLQPGDISADEQDEKTTQLAIIAEERQLKMETTSRPSNAADKKCIYSTFFKRRPGLEDELVLRSMQADKMQPLNEKNFKKYLRDYKRRKLQQPKLADFDTADIRLRDICTRAQFVGNFKPGRKPKALTARFNNNVNANVSVNVNANANANAQANASASVNEPPALVPIGGGSAENVELTTELLTDEPQQLYGRAALEPDELDELDHELQAEPVVEPKPVTPVHVELPKLEPFAARTVINNNSPKALIKAGTHITGSPTRELLSANSTATSTATTSRSHACYFSLLRDLFVSTPQHRLTYTELQAQLHSWRAECSISGLPDWLRYLPADWTQMLQSAVNFLSGDFTTLPAEYVPYIEHKTQLGIYQWIGAGRDSDARLQTLCQYWLQRRKDDIVVHQLSQSLQNHHSQLSPITAAAAVAVDTTPTPAPRCPTTWTVRVATQVEMLEFQRQERLRFEQPHRPFTYRMHGYESVVGPVKGIYTQSLALNKARGHAVMVDDRPPYVTILTLVRDATARLPNGEGTRSEISELLKCSQFVNRQAAENVLQTIVSGALDRMHGGVDPCVRYDARRKIWIYLHRNRNEADFERMHRQNQSMVKQKQQQRKPNKPKKDETCELGGQELPALVVATPMIPSIPSITSTTAATTTTAAALIKKHPQTMQVKCPPVPPLKYHIPPSNISTPATPTAIGTATPPHQVMTAQKSLLKSTQRSGVVTIVDRPSTASVSPVQLFKTSSKPSTQQQLQQQQQQQLVHTFSPARNTTPILVSTPTGLQTVHVAATPNKKLAIKKPIVISSPTAIGTGATTTGSFMLPLEHQPHQQQIHTVPNKPSPVRQQMPKNIIRLLPAGGGGVTASATGVATKPTVVQLPHTVATKPASSVQILGPRMLAQTTVRPLQQKIGAVSIVSNKPTVGGNPIVSATSSGTTTTTTGTIVKMSPQAFATLQQQQLKQKVVNPTQNQQPQQQQQQQRILVGNTAISSNKNIVFQALPKAAPKILSTMSGQAKPLATANLSPQQQRIVLQSFKQPMGIAAASGGSTSQATTATTRIIRTTPMATASPSALGTTTTPQSGHIITLDSLLQKSMPGKLLAPGSNIFQLATSTATGNVITMSSNGPGQLQTTPVSVTKQLPATARIVTAGQHTTMVPKIIGKTTVVPGKPLLLHAKTLKLGSNSVGTTQTTPTTTLASGAMKTTSQSIVIGGQTMKIQGATIPTRNAAGGSVQTVIMGNQLLRLATSSSSNSISTTTSSNSLPSTSSGIASSPKTLLIGAGAAQTLRLGKNVLLATSSGGGSGNVATTTTTTAVTTTPSPANNLVFAVQGNGGQLFFSPGLHGVNLKPLSSMKVIPMSTASSAVVNSGVKLSNVAGSLDGVVGKTLNSKLLPTAVLKTASGGHGN